MNFELGKKYIVEVTENGIIPREEFVEERFVDKDHDDLDFLTESEKNIVVNDVLDKIRAEIMQLDYDIETIGFDLNDMPQTEMVHTICREEVLQIIDKYIESEVEDETKH